MKKLRSARSRVRYGPQGRAGTRLLGMRASVAILIHDRIYQPIDNLVRQRLRAGIRLGQRR